MENGMIEYHKMVKHYDDKDNFQVFVFRFDRDEDTLVMLDLFVVTLLNGFQSKIRIDIQGFCENVWHHSQPLPEQEVDDLYRVVDNILDDNFRQQRDLEVLEQRILESEKCFAEELIHASELATIAHPPTIDFEEYVKNHKNSKSK
jgi:hypothetical protein